MGRDFTRRLNEIDSELNGGRGVERTDSVRGRLHSLEGTMTAMGVVTKQRVRLLRGWHAVILTACAVVTAACAVVTAVYVIAG